MRVGVPPWHCSATALLGTVLLAGVLLTAGCAGGATHAGSGVVILCGATEDYCSASTKAFTAKTGIPAGFVRLSSGEALARLATGKDAPEFDVWHAGPADGYVAADELGLLEPYLSPNASVIKPEWKDPSGAWTGVYLGVLGFCSNNQVLAGKGLRSPTSWADLTNPRFAGQVGVAHPGTSGTGYVALWTQVELAHGDRQQAMSYERALRPNILQYSKSGVAPVQQAVRGEIATGIVFSHDCVAAQEQGVHDLQVTFPAEGTGYEIGGVAIVKGTHNLASAKAYIDWALTAQAQEIGPTVGSYQVPTNPAAKVSEKAARVSQLSLVHYDVHAAGRAKSALVRQFDTDVAPASNH